MRIKLTAATSHRDMTITLASLLAWEATSSSSSSPVVYSTMAENQNIVEMETEMKVL
jgi:hypothetical protein